MHKLSYALRPSTPDDFEFVFQLNKINMSRYVEQLRGWNDEAERAAMRQIFTPGHDQIVLVNEKDVGICAVERKTTQIYLKHIELLPAYQGLGIGSDLIRDLIKSAHCQKLPVMLTVLKDNPAQRLYSRFGFQVTKEIDTGATGVKCHMRTFPN